MATCSEAYSYSQYMLDILSCYICFGGALNFVLLEIFISDHVVWTIYFTHLATYGVFLTGGTTLDYDTTPTYVLNIMCSDHRRGHSEDLTVNVIRNEVCHIELHFLYKIEHDHDKMLKMHLLLYYELQSRSWRGVLDTTLCVEVY